MSTPDSSPDGGAAFPFYFPTPMAGDASEQHQGMSCRALFAAILMHGELVTCGVPGEAAEALVDAAHAAGQDVVDHMAVNALESADALLRALAEPQPEKYRSLYTDEQMRLDAAGRLAEVVLAAKQLPEYQALPAETRARIEGALLDVTEPQIPF